MQGQSFVGRSLTGIRGYDRMASRTTSMIGREPIVTSTISLQSRSTMIRPYKGRVLSNQEVHPVKYMVSLRPPHTLL